MDYEKVVEDICNGGTQYLNLSDGDTKEMVKALIPYLRSLEFQHTPELLTAQEKFKNVINRHFKYSDFNSSKTKYEENMNILNNQDDYIELKNKVYSLASPQYFAIENLMKYTFMLVETDNIKTFFIMRNLFPHEDIKKMLFRSSFWRVWLGRFKDDVMNRDWATETNKRFS